MSKFENDKVMPRYFIIAVVLTIIGLTVVGKAAYIMTAKKDYWEQVASRLKRDSVSVKPNRGNILSCDGQLMASSIPEYNSRRRPFGSLAQRTVGDMFGAKDTARCGLELAYDSILRGTAGRTHRRKILNKYMNIPVLAPVDGCDIITTIDVGMQDLAERALIDELKDPQVHGDAGVAIVMEVATGDVKAMVNMTKCGDGEYREIKNLAVSNLLEPGSVFKTESIMVALDDGAVDTSYTMEHG